MKLEQLEYPLHVDQQIQHIIMLCLYDMVKSWCSSLLDIFKYCNTMPYFYACALMVKKKGLQNRVWKAPYACGPVQYIH